MIVRFDTKEEAKEKFEQIKAKYNQRSKSSHTFLYVMDDGDEDVEVRYSLLDEENEDYPGQPAIRMSVVCVPLLSQHTAMKIVDLMSEV